MLIKLRIINASYRFQHMAEYNSYATTFYGDNWSKHYPTIFIAK